MTINRHKTIQFIQSSTSEETIKEQLTKPMDSIHNKTHPTGGAKNCEEISEIHYLYALSSEQFKKSVKKERREMGLCCLVALLQTCNGR